MLAGVGWVTRGEEAVGRWKAMRSMGEGAWILASLVASEVLLSVSNSGKIAGLSFMTFNSV